MPRAGPRRPLVAIRMGDEATEWIDGRAIDEGLVRGNDEPNRSEMIRVALAYAQQHMPKGWRPGG